MQDPTMQDDNPIRAFAAWTSDADNDWPQAAVQAAKNAFIDTVGVMIAGAFEPVTQAAIRMTGAWGEGACTAVSVSDGRPAPWTALINGAAAHALDFDDNFDPAKAHASAVLVPAILAIAEQEDAGGEACIDAYIVGLQIMGRVGQGLNPYHRNRGWHATSTVGAVGAAAACARLLRLDHRQSAHALSIATSMAGGFMSQFGTMTKPLHAGLAAKAGVMAASLAAHHVDAGMDVLDGPRGMQRLMVGPDFEQLRNNLTQIEHGQTMRFATADPGNPLLILSSGLKLKRFPNCGSAHRAMDALLALREEMGFNADDLLRIRVSAPVSHLNNLMYTRPDTPAKAKFSLEYALVMIAIKGQCSLQDFTESAVADQRAIDLLSLVERNPVDKSEGEFATQVEVDLRCGRKGKQDMAMPIGSSAAPLSDGQIKAKFRQCVAGVMPTDVADELLQQLDALPSLTAVAEIAPAFSRLKAVSA